jgi:hypothetical protein
MDTEDFLDYKHDRKGMANVVMVKPRRVITLSGSNVEGSSFFRDIRFLRWASRSFPTMT